MPSKDLRAVLANGIVHAHEPEAVDRFVGDGKLQRGWVEQASFELYQWLLAK